MYRCDESSRRTHKALLTMYAEQHNGGNRHVDCITIDSDRYGDTMIVIKYRAQVQSARNTRTIKRGSTEDRDR